jgi:hypothetical protein
MCCSILGVAQEKTKVGGYLDTEWLSQGSTNTFKAHRLIFHYGRVMSPNVRFNSEIEYEYGGFVTNKDDANNVQNGEIKIEQAYVDYDVTDSATLRTGIVLVPVGQLNIYHDSDLRDFTARPLVNYYIIPTTWMDTGVGIVGETDVADMEITYEAVVINGLDHKNTFSSTKGLRNMRPNFKNDTNQGKAVAGRIGIIPNINSEFGLSTYQGQSKQSLIALDARYSLGALQFKGEYATYEDGYDNKAHGFNIEGKYNIASFIGRSEELNALARFEQVDLSADIDRSETIHRTSFGLNFRPVKSLVYKVEYSINDTQGVDDNTLMASVALGF